MAKFYTIGIQVVDNASPTVRKLGSQVFRRQLNTAAGRAVRNQLKDNFNRLESERSGKQMPGAASHYWANVSKSVADPVDVSNGVVVPIGHPGVALHRFGGTVVPFRRKRMSIAARMESYGKSPKEFDNLKVTVFKSGAVALVERESQDIELRKRKKRSRFVASKDKEFKKGYRGSRGEGVMFWLVKEVEMKEDKEVLPTDAEIQQTAVDAMDAAYNSIISRMK